MSLKASKKYSLDSFEIKGAIIIIQLLGIFCKVFFITCIKAKSIIIELYTKEEKPIPNFVVLKNCYNFIDLRKDGVIDLVEWCNVFGKVTGKLDLFQGLENKKGFKELKKWEMMKMKID